MFNAHVFLRYMHVVVIACWPRCLPLCPFFAGLTVSSTASCHCVGALLMALCWVSKVSISLPDKSLIMWKLTRDETNYGIPQRSLTGHSHFVSDVVISSDGQFALSGAWDSTLRLWDLGS